MNRRALLLLTTLATGACTGPSFEGSPSPTAPDASTGTPPVEPPPAGGGATGGPVDADGDGYLDVIDPSGTLDPEWEARLEERVLDHGAALRTASLRLRGTLPSMTEIQYLRRSADPKVAYEQLIDGMLEEPAFHQRLIEYFRDTFRMGGGSLDSAPVFAAQLVAEGRDFTELFTATSGTCPTYDAETDTFTPADCDNGVETHAGLLTHPAVMQQFASNLAFRRTRWVQEIFVCAPFPAEIGTGRDIGAAGLYTAPWSWDSISGADNGGRIDFHDTSSVICANCHATMNHVAPLFAQFDERGMWSADIAVHLPLDGSPLAMRTDWLPEGEPTAWRFGEPAPTLPALGMALAADEDVQHCTVSRAWNWAMGHGDVINQAALVPDEAIAPIVAEYEASGHDLRRALRAVFTSSDFVRF